MTQCSFIGSVAFALRCARRSRFTTLTYFPSFSLDCRAVLAFHSFPLFVYRPFYFHVSFLFSIHVPVRATCSDRPFAWKIAGYSLLIQRNIAYHCSYYFHFLWKILLEIWKDTRLLFLNYLRSILNFLISIQNISIFFSMKILIYKHRYKKIRYANELLKR